MRRRPSPQPSPKGRGSRNWTNLVPRRRNLGRRRTIAIGLPSDEGCNLAHQFVRTAYEPVWLGFVRTGMAMVVMLGVFSGLALALAAEPDRPIDFTRDVRPILSNHCWSC